MESELDKRIDKISHFSLDELKKILRLYKYEEYLRIDVDQLKNYKKGYVYKILLIHNIKFSKLQFIQTFIK